MNEDGLRKIDDPNDWVRKEVEIAPADSQKLVIPVLINNAKLPPGNALPESLRPLLFIQSHIIRDPYWTTDLQPLIKRLREHLDQHKDNNSSDAWEKEQRPFAEDLVSK